MKMREGMSYTLCAERAEGQSERLHYHWCCALYKVALMLKKGRDVLTTDL
jgi:hypothetical protein